MNIHLVIISVILFILSGLAKAFRDTVTFHNLEATRLKSWIGAWFNSPFVTSVRKDQIKNKIVKWLFNYPLAPLFDIYHFSDFLSYLFDILLISIFISWWILPIWYLSFTGIFTLFFNIIFKPKQV